MTRSGDIYSPYKAVKHPEKIEQLKHGETPICPQVQIDLTNRCNHNCVYCWYRIEQHGLNGLYNRLDILDTEWTLKLLENLKDLGVKAIEFTGGGEPLFHPDADEILEATLNHGLELAVVTNGALWTEKIARKLSRATWVRVSLDGITEETYMASQRGRKGDLDKALGLVKRIKAINSRTVVGVSFVINPINFKEIYQAAEKAKEIGADNIRFSAAYTQEKDRLFDGKEEEILKQCRAAKKLEEDGFKVFDLSADHLTNLAESKEDLHFCGYTYFCGVVGADKNLYSCCTLKYSRQGLLGKINDEADFGATWFGKKRLDFLKKLDVATYCKCPCWFTRKNRLIEYLIAEDAPHVNFV